MTIAVSLKVNDGVVLASDSATTLVGHAPNGAQGVVNVYNNANKVFNLCKGLPIGLITWGLGGISNASISTLARDLRSRLTEGEEALSDGEYSLADVASRVKTFFYDERYEPAFKSWDADKRPLLGFIVAGYSRPDGDAAEELLVQMGPEGCQGPELLRKGEESGVTWNGEPRAISRLVCGFDPHLANVLVNDLGVDREKLPQVQKVLLGRLAAPLIAPAMPIQDAIDLAQFLVELTIKWHRFSPGPSTVGGPIEVAAITTHEGFKWVERKHYFSNKLNPKRSDVGN